MSCNNFRKNDHQVTSKKFIKNFNKRDLIKELKNYLDNLIYYYIVETVGYVKDKFVQKGTGPNLEGNLITLCTCKHVMRTYPDIEKGTWIAGFTSKNAYNKGQSSEGNYLFYLFRINEALKNQHEYSLYLKENFKRTYNYKNSVKNTYGDLYIINNKKLIESDDNFYDPEFYLSPGEQHGHFKNKKGESIWHQDIKKVNVKNWGRSNEKGHKLLIGEKNKSFVWEKPVLKIKKLLTQGQSKTNIEEFLRMLQ
ncbi:MAG: hypothetical protein KDD00_15435 [Ignavibacteriae bacterium]|nr:hypothetical protein [Ignavibacteriota bacterium]